MIAVLCAEEVNHQEIANRENLKFLVTGKVRLLQGHERKLAVPAGREPAQVHQSTGIVLLIRLILVYCKHIISGMYNIWQKLDFEQVDVDMN